MPPTRTARSAPAPDAPSPRAAGSAQGGQPPAGDAPSSPVSSAQADLLTLLRETVRESLRSWRLPAAIALGIGFGFIERSHTGARLSLFFGPAAALYTLLLGPLPWRALVPLEADGQRARKLLRALLAAGIATGLFALLVAPYALAASALDLSPSYLATHPRELVLATLLFLAGGWGLARDVQLEQRLDRSLRRHGKLEAELEEARLYALRADLDPHFLFNALNAIADECRTDPARAEDNVVRLSSLLRAVLDTRRRPLHRLEEELALARDYLGLLCARYPALRFSVREPPELRELLVPPLLLQPLLENAVRHGKIDAGPLELEVREEGGLIVLEVRSPGPFGGRRAGGLGLELVERRVAMAWGEQGSFEITTREGATVARIVAPATTSV